MYLNRSRSFAPSLWVRKEGRRCFIVGTTARHCLLGTPVVVVAAGVAAVVWTEWLLYQRLQL